MFEHKSRLENTNILSFRRNHEKEIQSSSTTVTIIYNITMRFLILNFTFGVSCQGLFDVKTKFTIEEGLEADNKLL